MDERSDTDELVPDVEVWAEAHGFSAIEWSPNGETPLLREGMMPIAAASYAGPLAGRDAVLCEFAVGSPSMSDAFGGDGVEGSWFTLFLVRIDDPGFRRLTVIPRATPSATGGTGCWAGTTSAKRATSASTMTTR